MGARKVLVNKSGYMFLLGLSFLRAYNPPMRCRFFSRLILVVILVALAAPVLGVCLGCPGGMTKMTCMKVDESHAVYTQACCCGMRGLPKAAQVPEAVFEITFQVAGVEILPVLLSDTMAIREKLTPILFRHPGASQFSSPKHSISILKQSFLI